VPERALFFHHPHYTHASSPHSIVLDGPFKLIRHYNDMLGGDSLFNLDVDTSELLDLASAHPGIVSRLSAKLDAFLQSCDAEMPVAADSPEGKRLLELHAEGKTSGWSARHADKTEVMNRATERDLALEERAVYEVKLKP
jgi:hypothetical protein